MFNTYAATTENTLLNTVDSHDKNKIYLRTKADFLIVEDKKITGIKATEYDGTEVTLHASKSVAVATGGIHGGNRLGGNAFVEIFVSGRTAAQAIAEDNA